MNCQTRFFERHPTQALGCVTCRFFTSAADLTTNLSQSGQDRFVLSTDQFCQLVDQCHVRSKTLANVEVGIAIHSLRAASIKEALSAIEHARKIESKIPIHIHVAEQTAEIAACEETHGKRSVQFLYDNLPVDQHWCLIHATHLSDDELQQIVKSKAVVGLCPTTEANLGDGIFRAEEFLAAEGRFSIGSDSHCSIDLREELRILEYGQRLLDATTSHPRIKRCLGWPQPVLPRRKKVELKQSESTPERSQLENERTLR